MPTRRLGIFFFVGSEKKADFGGTSFA